MKVAVSVLLPGIPGTIRSDSDTTQVTWALTLAGWPAGTPKPEEELTEEPGPQAEQEQQHGAEDDKLERGAAVVVVGRAGSHRVLLPVTAW